jgi:type IV pilus assembly protein PilM
MIRLARTQIQPIGLDIGHDSIKMLQLERIGDSLSVVAAARQAMPPEARTQPEMRLALAVDLVRQMFRQGDFRGRNVVACLPREVLHIKNLRLPQMPSSELASVVQFESKNLLPFDIPDGQVRFLPAGEVRQGTEVRQEVIVLGISNQDINVFLESMHRCGTNVEALDIEPCALYRTVDRFIRRREDEQEVYVLLEVGFMRTTVVIGRGRDISFVKVIELGGKHFQEAVSRKLEITLEEAQSLRRRLRDPGESPEAAGGRDPVRQAALDATRSVMEQLGHEVSLCLRYYSVTFRGHRPGKVRLLGGEAADAQLQALLNAVVAVPVEVGRPLISVDVSKMKPVDRVGSMAEWAVALGLGLKRVQGTFGARDGKPREAAPAVAPSVVAGPVPAGVGAASNAVAGEGMPHAAEEASHA